MDEQPAPPGPWRWERVIPEAPSQFPPEREPAGEALVAADGTWLIWAESGYGSPDVHPAVKRLLADAWRLDQALDDRDGAVTMASHLLEAHDALQAGVEEAQAWARWAYASGRHSGSAPMPADRAPAWLTQTDEHL